MTVQQSEAVRNAKLDSFEIIVGESPILRIRTGAQPANCAASRTGTVLATLNLPSDWMAAASGGVKAKSGTWSDPSADATGIAGHYEIMDSGGTVCHEQGSVSATGGGGDMEVNNTSFAAGQPFEITAFSKTAAGA